MFNTYTDKGVKYYWKRFKKIWVSGKICHVHGLEDIILSTSILLICTIDINWSKYPVQYQLLI